MLKTRHIQVPEQVQIIGYDGVRKFEGRDLFCSTMIQPVKEIADAAVELLLSEGKPQPFILACLPVKYMPGGTTRDSDNAV
jgi:LacI family transcriptional regulator